MRNVQKNHPLMMIEDNDDDFEATTRALKASGFPMQDSIIRFDNGNDALSYLQRQGKYEEAQSSPRPGVILLDLNMPGMSGRDVLGEIKNNAALRDIPVIILTTSENEQDVKACYQLGANTYVKKPVSVDSFFLAIKKLSEYWFDLAILPQGAGKVGAQHPEFFKF